MASTATATVEVQLDRIESEPHHNHIHVEENSNKVANQVIQNEALPQPVEDESIAIDRQLALKLLSAGFSFFFAGINDGSLGTLIPYFRQTYNLGFSSTTIVTQSYGVVFAAWCLAGITNDLLLNYLNIGAILALGAFLQLLAHALRFWTPPFGVFCTGFALAALGIAYQDSHSNTLVSSVKGAHKWLGYVHACYAFGTLVAPFMANGIANAAIESGHSWTWSLFYLAPMGMGVVNLAFVLFAFRDCLWWSQKVDVERVVRGVSSTQETPPDERRPLRILRETVKLSGVWQSGLFFFFYLGASFSSTGWLVEYLVLIRHGKLSEMGNVPTAFAGGSFLGRMVYSVPVHRFGERRSLAILCIVWIGLQLVFWLVPSIPVNIAMIALIGFFSGPFFPLGISVASLLFSNKEKPAALGFIFIAAQAGGALFPTITGLIANHTGVAVLQPMTLGLVAAALGSWLLIPRAPVST